MARYEYRCQDCGARFEIEEAMAEHGSDGSPACPECGRASTEQVLSAFYPDTSDKT